MCESCGLNCTLIGQREKWRGYQWLKDDLFLPALRALPPERLVITMDAADMIVQASANEVLGRYFAVLRQHGNRSGVAVGMLESSCPRLPHGQRCPIASATLNAGVPRLTNLNGGFLMGPAHVVLDVWLSIGTLDPQYAMGLYALAHPDVLVPDTRQVLAGAISFQQHEWPTHYRLDNTTHRIANQHTGISPAFVHLPGTQESLRRTVYNRERMHPFDEVMRLVDERLARPLPCPALHYT